MLKTLLTRGLVVLLALVIGTTAYAQGLQTGVLTGTVVDADGLVLPGASVTVTSPSLQGARTTTTDANGVYAVRGLPPGAYTVAFELSGMKTVEATQRVDLGLTAQVDAKLQLATLTESVTVTAEVPSLVTTTTGGANYRAEEIDKLASPRTVQGVAELAPGLTDNTPNAGQLTIAGGFAYDNQFMVDGVDVADNLFANPNNLFIEDAVEEVQVLTSGISAEYGRFGGGVVNAITKSGSNTFSGSLRDNVYRPSWTEETPYEVTNNLPRSNPDTNDVQNVYEWTVGGPILKDRIWFFHSGRRQETTTPAPFQQTGIANSSSNKNNRFEIKGTATAFQNQTFQGTYLRNNSEQQQASFSFSVDPSTRINRQLPNDLVVGNWRGVLSNALFATVQVSRRKFGFRNTGGTSTVITDSPFFTQGTLSGVEGGFHYNAPYFDSNDPEDRDNRQVAGSLSYFLTSSSLGSHDLKVGYENFRSTNTGGNSQSSTGYVFDTDWVAVGGTPQLDSTQRPIPVFTPGQSEVANWLATRGAQLDITTQSIYANDRWAVNGRVTLDLGVRYELVSSDATGDIVGVDTSTVVPRLGATFDLTGDGGATVQTTYAHYAGKYTEAQIANNTNVGSPSVLSYQYRGPAGQGRDFAPGFNVANYELIGGNFPTANVFFDGSLHSPLTKEFTVSLGRQLGAKGAVKATYQRRSITGFIQDYVDDPTAKTTVIRDGVDFGTFDNVVFRNDDDSKRDYQAMVFQGNYRLTDRWSANAHWTLQLENNGTFEGEGTNTPGVANVFGDYPEIYTANYARNVPDGRLNDFQRSKVRTWTTYTWGLAKAGSVDTSIIYRYDSPLTYSLSAANVRTTATQLGRDPGYETPPQTQTLFFGERGTESFNAAHQVDLGVLYQVPVWTTLRPWFKVELYNMFNNQPLVDHNIGLTPDASSARDADGLPTGFVRGSAFGRATGNLSFPRAVTTPAGSALNARTILMSFGLRF